MTQEWYYQQNGQKHGPFTGAELKQLAAAGKLNAADRVKRDGMADWLPASQVKGLFPNIHDKVQQKADAVGKTAGTVSKVAKAAGKVSDAVSDVAEAGDKVQKVVTKVAGIAAGGSTFAGSIGDFLRPLGPFNLVIFAAALLSGGVLFVLAKKKLAVNVKFRLQTGVVASLAVAVIFGLWTGMGAVAGKGDKGFLATNIKPIEQLQASVVPIREPGKTEQPATRANPVALMKTSMGDIRLELFADKSPKTVANFLAYAEDGFYDGTIIHRVAPNFTIQGGGYQPGMKEKNPTRPPVPSESGNGLSNTAGTLAMARAGGADSATTQFFINVNDNSRILDRDKAKDGVGYCVFGRVVSGMEVVDRIKGVQTADRNGQSNVPVQDVKIFSIRRDTEIKELPAPTQAITPPPPQQPAPVETLPKGWIALTDTKEQVQKHWKQGDKRGSFFYDAASKTIKIKSLGYLGEFRYRGSWLEFQATINAAKLSTYADGVRRRFNLLINGTTTLKLDATVIEGKGPVRIAVKYDPKEHTIVVLVDGKVVDQATVTGPGWEKEMKFGIDTAGTYGECIISIYDVRVLTADSKGN